LLTGLIVLPGIEVPSSSRAPLIMRPYNHELRLCQRYFGFNRPATGFWAANSATALYANAIFDAPMRAIPTVSVVGGTFTNGAAVPLVAFKDVTGVSWDINPSVPYTGGVLNITTTSIGAQTYDRLGTLAGGVVKFDARL
jgi:hypothetical protein